ncbi:MAG: S9 family peptidase [Bacteroidetes bacterium]|nr:S9 family peptidase [Bacteroidota bacterium]
MKIKLILLSMVYGICCTAQESNWKYPATKKVDQTDTYHGTQVQDPYRWLESDTSSETMEWVQTQNEFTEKHLSTIGMRDSIRSRMTALWNYPKYQPPFKCGTAYLYLRNQGIENQYTLWYQRSLQHIAMQILDPARIDNNGGAYLSDYTPDKSGAFVAFNVARSGSDWQQIRVKEVKSAKTLTDSIDDVKFSNIAWQGLGFYYSKYLKDKSNLLSNKNENHKIYFHQLGTTQDKDVMVYEDKKFPLRNFSAQTTSDESFLIVYGSESTSGNSLMFKDLRQQGSTFITVVDSFNFDYQVIDNIGTKLLVFTNDGAPRGRLIVIDTKNPAKEKWQTLIAEQDDVMQSVNMCSEKIVVKYMHDARHELKIYNLKGVYETTLQVPGSNTIEMITSNREDSLVFFSATNFISPQVIYKYDVYKKILAIHFEPKLPFDKNDYETKQVFYKSKDGTRIPMFITYKKGIKQDGNNPVLLFGYGGFNISKTPEYKPERMVFIERGGIFAMPCIRGGGEYGAAWHKAGTKLQKQNVFDDFIAAAEFLVAEKYTTPSKLAISGRSNGGLLVGACMTQRPDLFKVALPAVGVLDMLRYHLFTIGWAWKTDYGCSDNESEFATLIKYSPLQNVKQGTAYPATLITTGDHDDRVVPAHSFKFAATLQAAHGGNNPLLIRIDTNAGHGAGKPTSKLIAEQTDVFSFMMAQLGMKF